MLLLPESERAASPTISGCSSLVQTDLFAFHKARLSLSHGVENLRLRIMPVKGGACPVRDTLFCNVIMLGDFLIYFFSSLPQLSAEDVFYCLRSRAKICNPAVVGWFASGFLLMPFDRCLSPHVGTLKQSARTENDRNVGPFSPMLQLIC